MIKTLIAHQNPFFFKELKYLKTKKQTKAKKLQPVLIINRMISCIDVGANLIIIICILIVLIVNGLESHELLKSINYDISDSPS